MRLAVLGMLLVSFLPSEAVGDLCDEPLNTSGKQANAAGDRLTKAVLSAYTPNPDDFDLRAFPTNNALTHNNAAAETCADGRRYIFYDPVWLNGLESGDAGKNWLQYAVFAHEVGHHLLNHFLRGRTNTSPVDQRRFELAADRVAGYTLAELGAGIPAAVASILAMSDPEDTDTHPGLCGRRHAFMDGFNSAALKLGRPTYAIDRDVCGATNTGTPGFIFIKGNPSAQWKDRAEYDVAQSVMQSQSAGEKVSLLDKWTSQYPVSQMEPYRRHFYFQALETIGDYQPILDYAQKILKAEPAHLEALSALLRYGVMAPRTEAWLDELDSTARTLEKVSSVDSIDGISPDAWRGTQRLIQAQALFVRGWIVAGRKDYQDAIPFLKQSIELSEQYPSASYLLGTSLLHMKDVTLEPDALYHIARAVAYRGPGELPEANRIAADDYLVRAYRGYRGSDDGLAELKAFTVLSALPPDGFAIANVVDIDAAKTAEREHVRKTDPQLALWLDVRDALRGPDGEAYFKSSVQDTLLPRFRAHVIRTQGLTVIAAVSSTVTEEVVLQLDQKSPVMPRNGDFIEFQGSPRSFSRDPFRVFLDVDAGNITILVSRSN